MKFELNAFEVEVLSTISIITESAISEAAVFVKSGVLLDDISDKYEVITMYLYNLIDDDCGHEEFCDKEIKEQTSIVYTVDLSHEQVKLLKNAFCYYMNSLKQYLEKSPYKREALNFNENIIKNVIKKITPEENK